MGKQKLIAMERNRWDSRAGFRICPWSVQKKIENGLKINSSYWITMVKEVKIGK